MTIDFLDMDVLIEAPGGDPCVRVIKSPAGETSSQPFVTPFKEFELANFLTRVGRPRTTRRDFRMPSANAKDLAEAKDVGGRLFGALFPGQAMTACLVGSLAEARSHHKGLRIRLRVTDCPEFADYPWEFLYDRSVDRFLCLSAQTPLVRYLELPGAVDPLPVESPLRILAVISTPSDLDPLNVEREWSNLKTAMAEVEERGLVEIDRLPAATMTELQRHLRNSRYHVLHFMGHGGFDDNGGVLVFQGSDGRSRLVGAEELGVHLHDHPTMGLVLLNSCEGARTGATDPFSGTAQELIQQGLGAVIAMQFEITDEAAISFSETFYESLVLGSPVDEAVAAGRKAVLSLPNPLEWATPVLYLRAPDGRIFDVTIAPGVKAAPSRPELPDDLQPIVPIPVVPPLPPDDTQPPPPDVTQPATARRPLPPKPKPDPVPVPWWRRPAAVVAAAVLAIVVVGLGIIGSLSGDDDGDGGDGDGGGGGGGEVETVTVDVPGDQVWTDAGIDIQEGDEIEIHATGSVLHNEDDPDSAVGPDGAGDDDVSEALNTPGQGVYVFPPGHGGLVARLGDGGEVFGVGAERQDAFPGSGPLQFGINDFNNGKVEEAVENNSGSFEVTVEVTRSG